MTVLPTRTVLAPAPAQPASRLDAPPTFSCVVAAYQVADMVDETIESLLHQTQPPLEILVVDDGSTDDLEPIVRRHGDDVRYLRHDVNAGAGAAKNTGARAAVGDYVVFVDADDISAPERLEALGELAAARPDLDLLTSDAWISLHGQVVRRFYDPSFPFEAEDQRSAILDRNFVFPHPALPRERFLASGGFEESIRWTSDWELWARMILSGSRVGVIDEPLATYRLRKTALSSQPLQQLRGAASTFEHIAEHPTLSDAELRFVHQRIADLERRILLGEAKDALRDHSANARRLSLAVAAERAHPRTVRAKALFGALAPRTAGRVLATREARSWTAAGGVVVKGDGPPAG